MGGIIQSTIRLTCEKCGNELKFQPERTERSGVPNGEKIQQIPEKKYGESYRKEMTRRAKMVARVRWPNRKPPE